MNGDSDGCNTGDELRLRRVRDWTRRRFRDLFVLVRFTDATLDADLDASMALSNESIVDLTSVVIVSSTDDPQLTYRRSSARIWNLLSVGDGGRKDEEDLR